MLALIQSFIELCLLRRAPQDLPASDALFSMALAADLLVGLLLTVTGGLSFGAGLAQSVVDILFMLVLLNGALRLVKRTARFSQTATALLGSSAVLGLLALFPISLISPGEQTGQSAIAALMFLVLVAWSILVSGHILRHTFDIRLSQGALIAVIYNLLAYSLMRGLFPSP